MEAIRISTERAPAPGGWYSQAYKIGNLIYTAGVTANDPETQKMVAPGDIIGQTEQIMKNMQATWRRQGRILPTSLKRWCLSRTLRTLQNSMKPTKNSSQIIRRQEALCKSVIF